MLSVVISRRNSSTTRAARPETSIGHLLQREHRALAPAVADRVGDFGAAVGGRGDLVDRVVADQVADVRDDPRRAGLDELVVVELPDVLLDEVGLGGQHAEQRLQLARRWPRHGFGRRQAAARTAALRPGS